MGMWSAACLGCYLPRQAFCYQATSTAEKVDQPWPAGVGAGIDLDQ